MNSATQAVMSEVDRGMEPRRQLYFRLEYPPPRPSEEDTESIDSIQDKETDFVQDTSDTDTKSDDSDQLEVSLEYEVASLSEDDENMVAIYSTSGTEDLHESAIAAVLCDSSQDAWATDGETSDGSSVDPGDFTFMDLRKDFWTCVQCKSQKQNPVFRYCDRCFQRCWQCKTKKSYQCFPLCDNCFKVRKTLFPPRPRGNRKRKLDKKDQPQQPQVKLDTLQSCLKQLSQESSLPAVSKDTAIGSNQELSGLDFNKIVVPEHLTSSFKRTISERSSCSDSDPYEEGPASKVRKLDTPVPSSQQSEFPDSQKSDSGFSEASKKTEDSQLSDLPLSQQSNSTSNSQQWDSNLTEGQDLCIMCNSKPKNGLFIHSRLAHMCCCYSCAMRTWKTNKMCPVCNCKVKNVMQLFTA